MYVDIQGKSNNIFTFTIVQPRLSVYGQAKFGQTLTKASCC